MHCKPYREGKPLPFFLSSFPFLLSFLLSCILYRPLFSSCPHGILYAHFLPIFTPYIIPPYSPKQAYNIQSFPTPCHAWYIIPPRHAFAPPCMHSPYKIPHAIHNHAIPYTTRILYRARQNSTPRILYQKRTPVYYTAPTFSAPYIIPFPHAITNPVYYTKHGNTSKPGILYKYQQPGILYKKTCDTKNTND